MENLNDMIWAPEEEYDSTLQGISEGCNMRATCMICFCDTGGFPNASVALINGFLCAPSTKP